MRLTLFAAIALCLCAGAVCAQTPPGRRAWVEMTGQGAEARLVTDAAACPQITIDGRDVPMQLRAGPSAAFPVTLCRAPLPADAKQAAIGALVLPIPAAAPNRILIFGDTGCRLKGAVIQDCNNARTWPFALVSRRAAAMKPDLIIHVGDYYYRESPCPAGDARCAGSPHGDTWASWDAEFFTPTGSLLDAAPWVFVRGNHESCVRGGAGWFRLLDAASEPLACPASSAAFKVAVGDLNLYVVDGADADDRGPSAPGVAAFSEQLDSLGADLAKGRGWILTHRPIWGLVPAVNLGPLGGVQIPINETEQAAVRGRDLGGVQMVVSGHIHHFASYDFGGDRPAQLIAGTGGDLPDSGDSRRPRDAPTAIDGLDARGFAFAQYGYFLLDRAGEDWTGAFRDLDDHLVATCRLHDRALTCGRVKAVKPPG